MLHKCKMTILDKKLYPELQEAYCADPQSGPAPATMWGTSLSLSAMAQRTIFGTWG